MKNRIKIIVAILSLLAMMPIALYAQTGTGRRVRFGRGRTSAVIRSSIKREQIITYLVGASAGQTMNIDITRGAAFRIYTPGGNHLQGGKGVSSSMDELDETGDYRIEVESRSSKSSVPFTLKISVQ